MNVKAIQVLVWTALVIIYLLIVIRVFADEPKKTIVRYEAVLIDNGILEVSEYADEAVTQTWDVKQKDFIEFLRDKSIKPEPVITQPLPAYIPTPAE